MLTYLYTIAQISADDLGLPKVEATMPVFQQVLNVFFMLAGALATLFIVIGGFKYVISAGNPEGIDKAKNTILYAVVGLVITIFAYSIVNFVISSL